MDLPGYRLTETLYQSADSQVARALRESDQTPVIVKFFAPTDSATPPRAGLAPVEREFQMQDAVSAAGVCRVLEVTTHRALGVLIMEDIGGLSLDRMIADRPLSVVQTLQVAVELCSILDSIHQRGMQHRDIAPEHIIWNQSTARVQIIDFGSATYESREIPPFQAPSRLAGTLAYISPEATGRLNQPVDYRTDYYSLGATLYHALTGRPPFTSADPLELIRRHLVETPRSAALVAPWVPSALGTILATLLAKNPDDRYHSARALEMDLRRLLPRSSDQPGEDPPNSRSSHPAGGVDETLDTTVETIADTVADSLANGAAPPFEPRRRDVRARFQIARAYYGRTRERFTLIQALERTVGYEPDLRPRRELVLITGDVGLGKSTLARELYQPLTQRRGYFAAGRFPTLRPGPAYSALICAFRSLLAQLLDAESETRAAIVASIRAALGTSGQVLVEVMPELSEFIDSPPPVVALDPERARNRFHRGFINLVAALARPAHPFVLFLDELQWADSASLALLEQLLGQPGEGYLLIVGAYRGRDVGPMHPLCATLERLRAADVPIRELNPQPLSIEHLSRMLVGTLDSDDNTVRPLAELMLRITGGNPFFAHEFLYTLYEQGLLRYRPAERRWSWNVAEIVWRDLADHVEAFVAGNIRRLSEDTQHLLRIAACLGHEFDLATAIQVSGHSLPVARRHLNTAVDAGFLQRPDSSLNGRPVGMPGERFAFRHALVRQAALQLFAEPSRRELHLHIGRTLLAAYETSDERPPTTLTRGVHTPIARIVYHLNTGKRFITDPGERIRLAELNLQISRQAEHTAVFAEAYHCLQTAGELLGTRRFAEHYPTAREICRAQARVALLAGDEPQAVACARRALGSLRDDLDRAEMYAVLLTKEARSGDYGRCLDIASEALATLDLHWPSESALENAIAELYARTQAQLVDRPFIEVLTRSAMFDRRAQIAERLLALATPAAMQRGLAWFTWAVLARMDLWLQHGPSDLAPALLTMYGQVLHVRFEQTERGLNAGRAAVAVLADERYTRTGCHTYTLFANWLLPWREPLSKSLELNRHGYRFGLENGDVEWAGTIAVNDIWMRLYAGMPLQATRERLGRAIVANQQSANKRALAHLRAQSHLIRQALDESAYSGEQTRVRNHESGLLAHLQADLRFAALAHFHIAGAFMSFVRGDPQSALVACARARVLAPYVVGHIATALLDFHESLARAALYLSASSPEQAEIWPILQDNYRRMQTLSKQGGANVSHLSDLMGAEIARLQGAVERAAAGYQRAAEKARALDFAHHEAVANELAGRLQLNLQRREAARKHLLDACFCYRLWGNRRKAVALRAEFAELLAETPVDQMQARLGDSLPPMSASESGRVLTACQAMIGELEMGPLLAIAMATALEITGARRGVFVLDGRIHLDSRPPRKANRVPEKDTPGRTIALSDYPWLATNIIERVTRTGVEVLSSDVASDPQLATDPYLTRFAIGSIICLPVARGNQSAGATPARACTTGERAQPAPGCVYLEAPIAAGRIDSESVQPMRLLSRHLAIAIGNARRYRDSRLEVAAKNRELTAKKIELRTALDHLETAQDNLLSAEKLASLGRISAGIAHELKNPLNFVVNFSEMAAELSQELVDMASADQDGALSGIRHDLGDLQVQTEQINKHAQRANSIIHGMMQHAGRTSSHRERVVINELVEQHLKLASSAPAIADQARAITIERDYDPDAGSLVISALEVGQVVLNLVNNAFYAVLDRRTAAHVEDEYRPTVSLTTRRHADRVSIRIGDNGTGIPAKIQPKIFEPFYTTKPPGEGTGLGLSLSHDIIVQGHGGTLSVDSELGDHTDFIIELPAESRAGD